MKFRQDRRSGLFLPDNKPKYSPYLRLIEGHPLSEGIVGFWLFNEAGGNTIFDLSGNQHRGTFYNDVAWQSDHRDKTALYFDGSSSYIDCGLFPGDGTIKTVSFWYLNSLQGGTRIGVSLYRQDTEKTYISPINSGFNSPIVRRIQFGGFSITSDADHDNDAGWHHIVATCDGTTSYLYYDGVRQTDTGGAIFIMSGDITLRLGADWSSGAPRNPFLGLLDQFIVYVRTLDDEEVYQLFTQRYSMLEEAQPVLHFISEAAQTATFTIDAHIAERKSTTFTLDVIVSETKSDDVTTDAIIREKVVGLISCEGQNENIYIHSGISSTILRSFHGPGTSPYGVTVDEASNICSVDYETDTIYIHSGLTDTITTSFATPSTSPSGISFDGANFLSCNAFPNNIYIHVGKTSTISSSFAMLAFQFSFGIDWDGVNVLSIAEDILSGNSIIYIHVGKTSAVNSSFLNPCPTGSGAGITYDTVNIISSSLSCEKIYVHVGETSAVSDSFASPTTTPTGLGLVVGDIIKTATFTIDAHIVERQTATFTSDTIIRETKNATFTLDVIVSETKSDSFTLDVIVSETKNDSFTLDVIIRETKSATFTIDAHISTLSTFTVDVVIEVAQTATFTIDAHIAGDLRFLYEVISHSVSGTYTVTLSKTTDGTAISKSAWIPPGDRQWFLSLSYDGTNFDDEIEIAPRQAYRLSCVVRAVRIRIP